MGCVIVSKSLPTTCIIAQCFDLCNPIDSKYQTMKKVLRLVVALVLTTASVSLAQCIEGNCYDGNGKFLFENGDMYNGLWKKGLQEGYGVYDFQSGDVYKGAWKLGKMESRGTYVYANGDKYIGSWKDGKMEGRGHFHWSLSGDLMTNAKYEGNFKGGQPVNIEVKETGVPAEPSKMK